MDYTKQLPYKVDENDCYIFTGCTDKFGYGQIKYLGKNMKAHRYIYLQSGKPLRDDQVIMHTCDNPSCIRIDHLRAATQRENILDMRDKGRGAGQEIIVRCAAGHALNQSNSYRYNGRTICKVCRAIVSARSKNSYIASSPVNLIGRKKQYTTEAKRSCAGRFATLTTPALGR